MFVLAQVSVLSIDVFHDQKPVILTFFYDIPPNPQKILLNLKQSKEQHKIRGAECIELVTGIPDFQNVMCFTPPGFEVKKVLLPSA